MKLVDFSDIAEGQCAPKAWFWKGTIRALNRKYAQYDAPQWRLMLPWVFMRVVPYHNNRYCLCRVGIQSVFYHSRRDTFWPVELTYDIVEY